MLLVRLIINKTILTLPYDRLLPFLPIATDNICFYWFHKIINPYNQFPPIFAFTTFVSPQMLDFFHRKSKVGIRNVVSKRIFSSEMQQQGINQIMKDKTMIYYNICGSMVQSVGILFDNQCYIRTTFKYYLNCLVFVFFFFFK